MLLSVNLTEKSFGPKKLFSSLEFSVDDGEKIGIVGRNGIGKTTLLNILTGNDKDFTGDIIARRGLVMVATEQEYHNVGAATTLEYIVGGLPDFARTNHIIENFAKIENPTAHQLNQYDEALQIFMRENYFNVVSEVREMLKSFQLEEQADMRFSGLSGGQKRLAEVIKIMRSNAHLALIDEPTNYMDHVAKKQFIEWAKNTPTALLIITHDRDVLHEVNRVIEVKDGSAKSYKGNYDAYLAQNSTRTTTDMHSYETTRRQIENLKKQMTYARSKKAAWGGTADKKNPFVVMEEHAKREIAELEKIEKPSFWIDKDSAANLDFKDSTRYEKYKDRNLRINMKNDNSKSRRVLIRAEDLSIGFATPLFHGKNFELSENDILEIHGRNGAGKTTLIKAILGDPAVKIFHGSVFLDPHARVGIYRQEVDNSLFNLNLHDAIEQIYTVQKQDISETKVRKLANDYLFSESDLAVLVKNLSGGQKARLQIIAMLSNDPNLLILDEPTSHLDLPSIEELETALEKYSGAVLYISHDDYFRRILRGEVVEI
jgi:ATPase subunit of ABC transporter with duplicated ATPase domains